MSEDDRRTDDIRTYRGRTLEELVPRIRDELGDDAVIVGRRETRSGGVGGFFAKREIEVDVVPAAVEEARAATPALRDEPADAAAAFRAQLERAQARQRALDVVSDDPAVGVDDIFRAPAPSSGLAGLFDVGRAPVDEDAAATDEPPPPASSARKEPGGWSAAGDADVVPISEAAASGAPSAGVGREAYEAELDAVLEADLDLDDGPPTEVFDSLAAALAGDDEQPERGGRDGEELLAQAEALPEPQRAPQPADVIPMRAREPEPEQEPVAAVASEPSDRPSPAADVAIPELEQGPIAVAAPPLPPTLAPTHLPPSADRAVADGIARRAAERMIDRGLDEDLATTAASEAVAGLLPFDPDGDVRALVARALARHLPIAPLRVGPAVVAFVGAGGAGTTRSVARLAAAYERRGLLPVAVVALRGADDGEELRRLLAPYGTVVTSADGADAARALTSEDAGERLVLIDTPSISARRPDEIDELAAELEAIGVDEIHLGVPATMAGGAAAELLDVCAPLPLTGLTITHLDETRQIGSALGLAIARRLPISYVGRGAAVDSGLSPASAEELAAELLS